MPTSKWLLIAHGTTDGVERARAMLEHSDHERIDVHTAAVVA